MNFSLQLTFNFPSISLTVYEKNSFYYYIPYDTFNLFFHSNRKFSINFMVWIGEKYVWKRRFGIFLGSTQKLKTGNQMHFFSKSIINSS